MSGILAAVGARRAAPHALAPHGGGAPALSAPAAPQVVLNVTRVYFYSEPAACAAFVTKIPGAWDKLGFNDSVRVFPERHEADLAGEHSFRRPIIDMVINETGARPARGGPLRAPPDAGSRRRRVVLCLAPGCEGWQVLGRAARWPRRAPCAAPGGRSVSQTHAWYRSMARATPVSSIDDCCTHFALSRAVPHLLLARVRCRSGHAARLVCAAGVA